MKRLILAVLIACSFLVGYSATAEAWPIYGRDRSRGYFTNIYDNWGTRVWEEGIPTWVNTPSEFISYVKQRLYNGNSQQKVGAAFIIQTMIGSSRRNPPSSSQVAEWEQRVNYASAKGWVTWNKSFTYSINTFYQRSARAGANPIDDAFYPDRGSSRGIEFRNSDGDAIYRIKHYCANPVGWRFSPLVNPPTFTITGRTTVSDSTLYPGQSVSFRHYLRNSGPSSWRINWRTYNALSGSRIRSGNSWISAGREVRVNTETFTVPSNVAFGTRYCRYVWFEPRSNGLSSGRGSTRCATVIPDYEVTPLTSTTSTTVQQNENVTFTYRIRISGNTRSENVACAVAGHSPGPGYSPLPQQNTNRNPKVSPQPGLNCNREFSLGTTTVGSETVSVGNAAPGSKICRSLVINPRNESGGYRSSAESCVVVAKTPYVHFMGNDVWAGGGFPAVNPACSASSKIQAAARTLGDGSVAGSAVEYSAFALGEINMFGSANKALINPAGVAGKVLTFSNIDSNNLGNYGAPQHCIEDYVDKYDKATNDSAALNINVGSQSDGTTLNLTGPRTFRGTMPVGSRQVYLVEGDVTIADNIRYPANYGGFNEIPSLVIIATGNITVSRNVEQMDGLFISRGSFFTCDVPVGTTLSVSGPCERQLEINGAVVAGKLELMRTYGAQGNNDNDRRLPAEVFNFNSEMYLRSALSGSNSNTLKTIDQRDLPPRF